MNADQCRGRRTLLLCAAILAGAGGVGCNAGSSESPGSGPMFSLFGAKKSPQFATVVHPDAGAALLPSPQFPASAAELASAPAAGRFGSCTRAAVRGIPPRAQFVPAVVPGESASAFRIGGVPGQPPLALVNGLVPPKIFEIWELDAADAAFTRKRSIAMPQEAGDWIARRIADVACLPAHRLFLAVVHVGAKDLRVAYRYDLATNALARVAALEHFPADFDAYLETREAGSDALVLRFDSDPVRLGPLRDANGRSHFLLYSARHPDGIEFLVFGLDDGAVGRWSVVGATLWLEIVDPRDPARGVVGARSLDLAKLL